MTSKERMFMYLATVLLAGTLVARSDTKPNGDDANAVVRAKRFELLDKKGQTLVALEGGE